MPTLFFVAVVEHIDDNVQLRWTRLLGEPKKCSEYGEDGSLPKVRMDDIDNISINQKKG